MWNEKIFFAFFRFLIFFLLKSILPTLNNFDLDRIKLFLPKIHFNLHILNINKSNRNRNRNQNRLLEYKALNLKTKAQFRTYSVFLG